jgi:hypothetical protein
VEFHCIDGNCEYPCEACIAAGAIKPEKDITRPTHYHKGGIDVIDFMKLHFPEKKYTVAEGFFIGNILKYTCRYKEKNGQDDLIKAKDYLERLMELDGDKS